MIKSPDWFMLDGESSEKYGVYVDTPPMPPMPERKRTVYSLVDGEEDGVTLENSWENVTISVKCYVFSSTYEPSEFYGWLQNKKNLQTSTHKNYVYRVKHVLGVQPEKQEEGKNLLTVSFVCSPFRYRADNEVIDIANGEAVECWGYLYARPIISAVTTSDTAEITINGEKFSLNIPNNTNITINSEKMLVYGSDGTVYNQLTEGKFPLLSVTGEDEYNIIRYTGLTDVRLRKNERWL